MTAIATGFVVFSCSDDIADPPLVEVRLWVEGREVAAPAGTVTDLTGKRVDYLFTISANTAIAQVRTINSIILNDNLKTVDETITMGFTDKFTDQVRGTLYISTIGTQVRIVVTDTDGNQAQGSVTVYPSN